MAFRRGDVQADGRQDVSDGVFLPNLLARFSGLQLGGGNPRSCSADSPDGACPYGGECVEGECVPASCPQRDFGCGAARSYSNLEGVRIEFPEQPCRYTLAEAAAGIELRYDVVVEKDLGEIRVHLTPELACRGVAQVSSLSVIERIVGDGQSYCRCDFGISSRGWEIAAELEVGHFPVSVAWDGRNWNGPSDTRNEPGPLFPPGESELELIASGSFSVADDEEGADGKESFQIYAVLMIELVDE